MKRRDSAKNTLKNLEALYLSEKNGVFALAAALVGRNTGAFRCVEDAFFDFAVKDSLKGDARSKLYKYAVSRAERLSRKRFYTVADDRGMDEAKGKVLTAFFSCGRMERAAYVCREILKLNDDEARALLRVDGTERLYRTAAEKLAEVTDSAPPLLEAALSRVCDGFEVWDTLEYRVDKKLTGALPRKAAATVAITAAAVVLVCGAALGALTARFNRLPAMASIAAENGVTALSGSYTEHYTYKPDVPSEEQPRIASRLWDVLSAADDDDVFRVAFRYYDSERDAGLVDLYVDSYTKSNENALVNLLICVAVRDYYLAYDSSVLPQYHTESYVPPYPTLYDCVVAEVERLEKEGLTAYRETFGARTDVFGSREAFEDYITGDIFAYECYPLRDLMITETYAARLRAGEIEMTAEEADTLINEYERMIYAFHNGYNCVYMPSDVSLTNEEYAVFLFARARCAAELTSSIDEAVASYGFTNLRSEAYTAGDCSAYSADMTRADILKLAADGRFYFCGLDYAYNADGWRANMSGELSALLATVSGDDVVDVMTVSAEYTPYNRNYAVRVALPYDFIESVRDCIPCRNSRFEDYLGYGVKTMYALRRKMTKTESYLYSLTHPDTYMMASTEVTEELDQSLDG